MYSNMYLGGFYMNITINGLNIEYTEKGEGKPILFLHGWGSSFKFYENIMTALSDRFRTVAVNFPGCGSSDTMSSPWDLDDYCNFVIEFMNKLNITDPIMIGHSHGGRVILKMSATGMVNPQKIVLLDSAGLIPKKSFKQKFRAKSFKAIKRVLTLPVIKNYSANLLDKARRHYGSADYNAAPEVLRKTLVSLVNTDLRDIIANIKCSTLLIWGDRDTDTPLSDAKIIESLIPDAGLCVYENAGHFAFFEQQGKTIAILNSFLGKEN